MPDANVTFYNKDLSSLSVSGSQNSLCMQPKFLAVDLERHFRSIKNGEGQQAVEKSTFLHFTTDECLGIGGGLNLLQTWFEVSHGSFPINIPDAAYLALLNVKEKSPGTKIAHSLLLFIETIPLNTMEMYQGKVCGGLSSPQNQNQLSPSKSVLTDST